MGKRRLTFASAAMVVGAIGAGGIATAHGKSGELHTVLRGANETQAADPDGRGTAKIDIDAASGKVCWTLRFDRIATPTMAHIHKAPTGVPGPVVVLFFAGGMPPSGVEALERGRADGCTTADPALAADIVAHPDQYYVNIHNLRFPQGAVRGQLH